jgi:catechol 2,3-dioxygenase-like lactoylglutathione lyase family enzyme
MPGVGRPEPSTAGAGAQPSEVGGIGSLNHVGLAVADLDAASARYAQLGFTLTPLSVHEGSSEPGGPLAPIGSGNRCAVFAHSYLEILARVGETPPGTQNRVDRMLARHEGAHVICFGCDDAAVAERELAAAGISSSGVVALQREVDTPTGPATARFERVLVSSDLTPEGLVQAAHHRTPEHVHQPRYLQHANGATELTEVLLAVDDPGAAASRYARILGREPHAEGAVRRFELPRGSRVTIVAHSELDRLLPGSTAPPPPCIAAVTVSTRDLAALRSLLAAADIRHTPLGATRLLVPADQALGLALVFEGAAL